MKALPPLDMVRLSDLLLMRLNNEGKVQLSHNDLRIDFTRDENYPGAKFNIHVFVFGEEFSNSYFSSEYDTAEKIMDILFLHAQDDYGHADVRHGLITVKLRSLETRLIEVIPRVRELLKKNFSENDGLHADIYVDEVYPYDNLDPIGLPYFLLFIILPDGRKYSVPFDASTKNIQLGKKVLEYVVQLRP